MKVDRFVSILKEIEKQPTIYYSKAGGAWCKWNGTAWNMDCVCMIKGVLWGFDFNKSAAHGGAIYESNGVYDDDANGILKRCYDVSKDFSHIEVGELMHMDGHVGIYIGNRKVVEATAAWDYKVQISEVAENGRRSKNGVNAGYWKEHGKLMYVDYAEETPDYTGVITYQAYTNKWLPPVNKSDDTDNGYAGIGKEAISGFRCKPQYGELIYEAHIKGGEWLSKVNSKDYSSGGDNSYAGIYGKPIDCIRIKSTKGWVKYRVKTVEDGWLAWVDSRTESGTESYAGIYGHNIIGIQMY